MGVSELLKTLGVDLENKLLEHREADLRSLLNAAIKNRTRGMNTREAKGLIVHMLLDEEYFSTEHLLDALHSGSSKLGLARLLEEPRNEG